MIQPETPMSVGNRADFAGHSLAVTTPAANMTAMASMNRLST